VWCLDLLPYFKTGLKVTKEDGTTAALTSEWKTCESMQNARSNFAALALRNYIYAYGGISGAGTGQSGHHPMLSEVLIERYLIAGNTWESVAVNTAPKLAAFSWC
jgi:hypothetical protein